MSGITTRKSYTKIKNFTEKDQVRIKYSHIGKDKKLMLSVYIGEDVYTELTKGYNFKRLKVEYIPNDMVIITPTNDEKEGVVHRYNGKGMFKTTCVRLSLSSYKTLKVRKKDFNNRVIGYDIVPLVENNNCLEINRLKIDLISDKRKLKVINKRLLPDYTKPHIEVPIDDIPLKEFRSIRLTEDIKSIDISPTGLITPDDHDVPSRVYKEDMDSMIVTHHYLNDVRDTIENRLLGMEERFEKRVQEIESLLKEFMDQPLRPLKTDKGNTLDIDSLKQLLGKANDVMNFRLSKIESEINELIIKNVELNNRLSLLLQKLEDKTADPEYMSFRFMEIKDLLNQIKKSHRDKSLFEKIFGKD